MPDQLNSEVDEQEKGVFDYTNKSYGRWKVDYNPDNLSYSDYRRMMVDAQIAAAVNLKKTLVLMKPFMLVEKHGITEDNQKIIKAMKYATANLEGGISNSLNNVLNAYWTGYTVTERVWTQETEGRFKGLWFIKKFKTLKQDTLMDCFKTDEFNNLKCVVQTNTGGEDVYFTGNDLNRLAIYTNEPMFGNRYGNSDLRAAYNAWYQKFISHRAWGVHVERKGSLPFIGKFENDRDKEFMKKTLLEVGAESVILVPKGSEVDLLKGDVVPTQTFEANIRYNDQQIFLAILVPTLVMGIEQTGARSLGDTHFAMFMYHIESRKRILAPWIYKEYYRPQIEANFGKEKADEFTVAVEPMSDKDKFKLAQVYMLAVNAGYVDPSLKQDADFMRAELGMPAAPVDHVFQRGASLPMDYGEEPSVLNEAGTKMPAKPAKAVKAQKSTPTKKRLWDTVESSANRENFVSFQEAKINIQATEFLEMARNDYVKVLPKAKDNPEVIQPKLAEAYTMLMGCSKTVYKATEKDTLKKFFKMPKTATAKLSVNVKAQDAEYQDVYMQEVYDDYMRYWAEANQEVADKYAGNLALKIRERILYEMEQNPEATYEELVDALDDEFAKYSRAEKMTLVKTIARDYFQTSRTGVCKKSGIVEGYEFRSALLLSTTDFCRSIHQRTISAKNPLNEQFEPPFHYNCYTDKIPLFAYDNVKFDDDWDMWLDRKAEVGKGVF